MISLGFDGVLLKFLDSSPKLRRLFVDAGDLHRVLRLECEVNIALLRCADLESDGIHHQANGYLHVADKLEYGALAAAVGHGEKADKFLAQLRDVPLTESPPLDDGVSLTIPRKKPRTVQQKLEYLFVAVRTVKSASELLRDVGNSKASGIRELRIRRRLAWLETTYREISKLLDMAA